MRPKHFIIILLLLLLLLLLSRLMKTSATLLVTNERPSHCYLQTTSIHSVQKSCLFSVGQSHQCRDNISFAKCNDLPYKAHDLSTSPCSLKWCKMSPNIMRVIVGMLVISNLSTHIWGHGKIVGG